MMMMMMTTMTMMTTMITTMTMMMMMKIKDEVKCSLHNGNAEANFGDKLSFSLSGMNNLSYSNSQIRFLFNFETFNATFRMQDSMNCKDNYLCQTFMW